MRNPFAGKQTAINFIGPLPQNELTCKTVNASDQENRTISWFTHLFFDEFLNKSLHHARLRKLDCCTIKKRATCHSAIFVDKRKYSEGHIKRSRGGMHLQGFTKILFLVSEQMGCAEGLW